MKDFPLYSPNVITLYLLEDGVDISLGEIVGTAVGLGGGEKAVGFGLGVGALGRGSSDVGVGVGRYALLPAFPGQERPCEKYHHVAVKVIIIEKITLIASFLFI